MQNLLSAKVNAKVVVAFGTSGSNAGQSHPLTLAQMAASIILPLPDSNQYAKY
jgi:hypothetical protein